MTDKRAVYDRSFLCEAELEFLVVADTHYMLDTAPASAEFNSRKKQSARAEVAWSLAASLDCPLILHLGDVVQEYPDTVSFPMALQASMKQIASCGVSPRHVAGNHDVGDKPDPVMPTRPVTSESLEQWHKAVGPSWYSFDHHDCHFVVVNSQILNTSLPEAESQSDWLEQDLQQHNGRRIFIFLHLPPYLGDTTEEALGNYDNLGEPARGWLLQLVKQFGVELLMAAHVHCSFFDRIGTTRYFIANSTAFTRPGFCHMFTSGPPPEQGRDDVPKLGFYLCRVRPRRTDVHLLRTNGATDIAELTTVSLHGPTRSSPLDATQTLPHRITETNRPQRLVTRTSSTLQDSPLALSLYHPLCTTAEIPIAWPSAIRQRIRNDYPLLSCTEIGASAVRLPLTDLADPFLSRRISVLRDECVRIVATVIWSKEFALKPMLEQHATQIDGLELQLAGTPWPDDHQLRQLRACMSADTAARQSLPAMSLSAVVPGESIEGKQHPRTRHGFRLSEVSELDERLATAGVKGCRVLCRLTDSPTIWHNVDALAQLRSLKSIAQIDLSLEIQGQNEKQSACAVAEAFTAMLQLSDSRLYINPLNDFDRTMDVRHGLLDSLCNPRPAYHVLRCLNTIAAVDRDQLGKDKIAVSEKNAGDLRVIAIQSKSVGWRLILPVAQQPDAQQPDAQQPVYALTDLPALSADPFGDISASSPTPTTQTPFKRVAVEIFYLAQGLVVRTTLGDEPTPRKTDISEPVLVRFQHGDTADRD